MIIPTYRRANLIGRAIQSIISQTYKDFEIIVVDDGSNDNTEETIRSIKDERIIYIRHDKNQGAPAARNTGIKAALGNYIAFQDSDDYWHPQKLEKQIKVFENSPSEVGVVYTGFFRIVNGIKEYIPYSWVTKKEGDIHKELLKGNFIALSSIVVRKECFKKVGLFDERLPRLQDWEFVIRISKYYSFKFIEEPLLTALFTPDSLSASEGARIIALKLILSKHLNGFTEDKESLIKYYHGMGLYLCLNNEAAEGESYFAKAFKINPNRRCLSENYFKVGRRLWANGDSKNGKSYIIKAMRTYPLNVKIIPVTLFLILGSGVYKKLAELYRKIS